MGTVCTADEVTLLPGIIVDVIGDKSESDVLINEYPQLTFLRRLDCALVVTGINKIDKKG
jgi:hypothetical protein